MGSSVLQALGARAMFLNFFASSLPHLQSERVRRRNIPENPELCDGYVRGDLNYAVPRFEDAPFLSFLKSRCPLKSTTGSLTLWIHGPFHAPVIFSCHS